MSPDKIKSVSEPTLRRLPSYLHLLKRLDQQGRGIVSCTYISKDLKLDPTQVRKDLAATGIVGKPKIGYDVNNLIRSIESFLDWNNQTDAFLAGVGNLGRALMGYERFKDYGLNIVGVFDSDHEKIGTTVADRKILPIAKLPELARRMHINIGMITAPAEAAQIIADLMIEGGIIAIWNFAPTSIKVPDNVIVEKAHLYTSLAVLSHKLAEALANERSPEEKGIANKLE